MSANQVDQAAARRQLLASNQLPASLQPNNADDFNLFLLSELLPAATFPFIEHLPGAPIIVAST